ncbi:MAG: DUF4936 family protein [Betaproteobacteria bacterium]
MSAPAEVFVYYRVAGDESHALRAIAAMVASVEARTGVTGRLLKRCDDPKTWMEVYAPVPDMDRFRAILHECARQQGVAQHAEDGKRQVECFTAVASCGPDAHHAA